MIFVSSDIAAACGGLGAFGQVLPALALAGGPRYGQAMRAIVKALLPVGARTQIKRAGYAALDILSPITAPRVPPRRETFIGGGDFETVGAHFFEKLREHGLTQQMDVLDVGCGQGRMARPLAGWLRGQYCGFDISRGGIDWCEEHYADMPNFAFTHADIFNARYNKDGAVAARDFRFPYADNRFDCIFATSVFTHMFAEDIENYLQEIARVLRPEGRALITWFLKDLIPPQNSPLNFAHRVDAQSYTTLAETPEAAMAFDADWVRALYAKCGLEIAAVETGGWHEGRRDLTLQDLVVAGLG